MGLGEEVGKDKREKERKPKMKEKEINKENGRKREKK